ncbi:hypothetical protein NEUTE1DRAFT_110749 [Neurospora tetrasperma FGSC 2508]|uniref:Uncharacterized protein n=1 Tax=Neurospora tetrasperma (strain FGSC 2508 / ATCC MYA-4615 / P0657) TaxID=510951 RepID=F8MNR3_NEUT8|nr:uncharacterized protein NEUTE1DRAFT_110749 [Neurospora tetrasperma FGSC 2508]EGO56185.1 hypothetical protein NEUTE1DRAFT_110749 [Neurospora tetrasperma FGSC 2508]EGZ70961.1 hypothetical protein NEUTE2DRAFT_168258 [Neurospora tetrasperma FGSC 2509]
MSTPSPSGAPKPPPPAIIPVTPLPDSIFVLPPPSTTAQSAKRARIADEEARYAYNTTASLTAPGPITSFAETVISKAFAKAEIYRSFTATLNIKFARFSVVSPAYKSSTPPPSPTPDPTALVGKNISTSPIRKGKGPIAFAKTAARGTDSTSTSRSASNSYSNLTRKATVP